MRTDTAYPSKKMTGILINAAAIKPISPRSELFFNLMNFGMISSFLGLGGVNVYQKF
jgi:hypothetical protein